MTKKELRSLNRRDLLELLVEQSRETARHKQDLEDYKARLEEVDGTVENLKRKLNEKDAQIQKLAARLDEKDAKTAEKVLNYETTFTRLKSRLDEKDNKIAALETELNRLHGGGV